jgi:hypothetical protein
VRFFSGRPSHENFSREIFSELDAPEKSGAAGGIDMNYILKAEAKNIFVFVGF